MSLKYSWRIFLCTSGGDEFLVSNVHLNISSFKLNSHCSAAKPWRQKKIGPRIFNELTKQRILPAFIVPDMRHDLMRDILPVLYHYVVTKYHPTNTNRHFDQFVSFSKIVLMTQYTHFVILGFVLVTRVWLEKGNIYIYIYIYFLMFLIFFQVIARENKGPGIGIEYAYSRAATSVANPSPKQLQVMEAFKCLVWIKLCIRG